MEFLQSRGPKTLCILLNDDRPIIADM